LHRSRQLTAKSVRMGKRVVSELRNPSDVEKLMGDLPEIATASQGLAGKVVVITGATQGVGLTIAKAFAARSAKVVINGRRADALEVAVRDLNKNGADVVGVLADISTPGGAKKLISETTRIFGTLDILINNAAIAGPYESAWNVDVADMDETLRVNLNGSIYCALEAVRWFVDKGVQGRVINVSSITTEGDYPKFMPYSTSKAGLEAFTRYIAADLPKSEVIVTGLILPSVQTERKFAADWASTELLPPADILVPAFEHCATGPGNLLHGRTISAARFILEPIAEAQLASVASVRQQIQYPELEINGKVRLRRPQEMVLLDRAENQFGTSPKALAAVIESLNSHSPSFYPDERFHSLRNGLAKEHGLEPDNFAFGPGSWELIARALQVFVKPGEEVISSGPGWFGFNLTCQRQGIAQRLIPFDRGDSGNRPSHNLEEMRRAITSRTRLIYLITPSNPEGVSLQHTEMREFLEDVPPELPVMIDEAYVEFSNDPGMVDVAKLIREENRSVIGLRTFSKFYALAGLRVGYAYAKTDLVNLIRRSEQIFTLAHVAEVAAVAALEDKQHRKKVYDASLRERESIQRSLTEMGISYIPSHAPYIFAQAPNDFEGMADELAKEGIIIARYRFNDGKMVMLPVGTAEQNQRILAKIRARQ